MKLDIRLASICKIEDICCAMFSQNPSPQIWFENKITRNHVKNVNH